MKKITYLFLAFIALSVVACEDKYPDLQDGIYAEIVTDKGIMLAELYYDKAPATVANFVSLAEGTNTEVDSAYKGKPFYNGLTFHRIIKDFMIQGGDPQGTGSGGPGYKFHDELTPELRHDTIGVLSMANSGVATNGSQFFITHKATPHLDGYTQDGQAKDCGAPRTSCHTVFGKLVEGFETINAIANVEMKNPRAGKPKDTILIEEVNIIRKGSSAKKFDAPKVFKAEIEKKAEEERKAAEALAKKKNTVKERFDAQKEKAKELESGLSYYITEEGNGPKPKTGQTVLVDYAGYFTEGELFDTNQQTLAEDWNKQTRPSPDQYGPFEVLYSPDAQMIAGFKEGIQQLKVGDKATLFIPYHLGYGERGYAIIPPKTDLVFEIEILEIK